MRGYANNVVMGQNYHNEYKEQMNFPYEMNKNYDQNEPLKPELKLARAYVPFQEMHELYSLKEGLIKGTIFPELYSPY